MTNPPIPKYNNSKRLRVITLTDDAWQGLLALSEVLGYPLPAGNIHSGRTILLEAIGQGLWTLKPLCSLEREI